MGDAVAHAVLPGIAGALAVGVSPWAGMLPAAIGSAMFISYLTRRAGVLADTSIAIVFTTLFAAGVLMISLLPRAVNINLEDILLGQVFGVSLSDVYWTLAMAITAGLILAAFFHKLTFVSFDAAGAEVAGINTRRMDYLLLGLVAVVVLIAVQAVGIILSASMLVTPAATAMLLARKLNWILIIATLSGLSSVVIGLYLSYYFNLPAGPAIALTTTTIFVISMLVPSRGFKAWMPA